jgi:hypothetical protein
MSNLATPRIRIRIYPFSGGEFVLDGSTSQVLRCSVSKSLKDISGGKFNIVLAPGGPGGTNDPQTWDRVITPMSLCIIDMARDRHAQTVMVGLVTETTQTEIWNPGNNVRRTTQISGMDFMYFFVREQYYTLSAFGLVSAQLGQVGGLAIGAAQKYSPAQAGNAWYNEVLGGKTGLLSVVQFNLGNGKTVSLSDILAVHFQSYITSPAFIPIYLNFLLEQGSWWGKFYDIFPFPFYELLLLNAPVGNFSHPITGNKNRPYANFSQSTSYVSYSNVTQSISGIGKTSDIYQAAPPAFVARVNPLPYTYYNSSNSSWTWDATRWNQDLWRFSPENLGFFETNLGYGLTEVRNLYVVESATAQGLLGLQNTLLTSAAMTFGIMMDGHSIEKYGYRPEVMNTLWFVDGKRGVVAVANQQLPPVGSTSQLLLLFQEILGRLASYYEPTPHMLSGTVTMPLRPDIVPGNRFEFDPFKVTTTNSSDPSGKYAFYIEGISHDFVFGERSSTTLQLSRGLLLSDYANENLMIALHRGLTDRQNGILKENSTITNGLKYFTSNEFNTQTFLGQLPPLFSNFYTTSGKS